MCLEIWNYFNIYFNGVLTSCLTSLKYSEGDSGFVTFFYIMNVDNTTNSITLEFDITEL